MKTPRIIIAIAALLVPLTFATAALAQESKIDVAVLGGIHALNQNDTALPDNLMSVPAVLNATYRLTQNVQLEGDFAWLIPMTTSVELASGVEEDRKAPDVLSYQAGLRVAPVSTTWAPYLGVGVGAMTFLSSTESDRLPALDESQTMFALSFGGGADFPLTGRWAVRADFKEFVAFPGNDTEGFSDANGESDPIWMERGAVGLAYRF